MFNVNCKTTTRICLMFTRVAWAEHKTTIDQNFIDSCTLISRYMPIYNQYYQFL